MADREVIYSYVLEDLTDTNIRKAVLYVEGWVRRNLREWPYNHDLCYHVRTGYSDHGKEFIVDFFFLPMVR